MTEQPDRHRDLRSRALDFERYALALLSAEALAEGRTLLIGNEVPESLSFADGFAPAGLMDLPGPCFVDVKLRFTDRVWQSLERGRAVIAEGASYLLVLYDGRYPRERFPEDIARRFPGVRYRILGRDDLDQLAARHPTAAFPFDRARLDEVLVSLRSTPSDSTRSNEQHVNALRAAYNDDRLALFIGAGVPRSVGYPDWPELVRRIAATVFDQHSGGLLSDEERQEVQRFFEAEVPSSPLIVARLLRGSMPEEFAARVQEALYDGTRPDRSSPLLEELAMLCTPRRDSLGIVAVVNYNFDDLLEQVLARRGVAHRSIFAEGDKALRSELPIYHVHGFLPRNVTLGPAHHLSLVLSEDAYHTQFIDPFVWPNITQLNLLRNSVCLFIGMSINDPNQRRLLEITVSKTANVRHYAILKDHWTGQAAKRLSPNAQSLARVFKGLEETSLKGLGVTPIWIDEYEHIPGLISSIRRVG